MLIIEDKLVSLDLIDQHFVCQLDICKGACCWEGDLGAPLEEKEIDLINEIKNEIIPLLSEESKIVINKKGISDHFKDENEEFEGTPLMENGSCAYLIRSEGEFAQCAFEVAYKAGNSSFYKPISCHLYPVRITESKDSNFIALNYDKWDICKPACNAGKKQKVPLYRFVKEALIRKYGHSFYHQLDRAAIDFYKRTNMPL